MKILVGCEFSGIVREALRKRGHDAWSCDYLPTEIPGPHIVNDVRNVLDDGWDMMIAFPPCTHLARSGSRHWHKKQAEQRQAIEFVDTLWNAPIPAIAIENPLGILSYRKPTGGRIWRAYDQLIQPWQFGHPEKKGTCLWLKGLPCLMYTLICTERYARVHRAAPGPDRWAERSRTLPGIASAMAAQWAA